MLNCKEFIIYAQALDNSGSVDMFSFSPEESCFQDLSDQPRDEGLLKLIDQLLSSGASWKIGKVGLKVYVDLRGNCVVEAVPQERDTAGRLSPVHIIFNALGQHRKEFVRVAESISAIMNRNFDVETKKSFASLQNLLNYPAIFIFLRILFAR